jgi:hypothetical protein
VPIADDLTIALLISVDLGVAFAEVAGGELAAKLAPFDPEIVVSVATMGIPIAIEVTRALGFDDYVILHKTPKIHLADAVAEPVRSITTAVPQRLLLDRARVDAVVGPAGGRRRRRDLHGRLDQGRAQPAAAGRRRARRGRRGGHRGRPVALAISAVTQRSCSPSARSRWFIQWGHGEGGDSAEMAATMPTTWAMMAGQWTPPVLQ